ncbi:MAG: hypothetical protein LKK19_04315 [Bacteroidales bacterium]|jgi:hypothetical protein|nr:hypothetical protein [Bacteroidales bacterium]MCI2121909.1 hypothetical protein [Bacteroidales bacterium]MCI2146208.1 hypothetical protein [Bacteroidales bacterium]
MKQEDSKLSPDAHYSHISGGIQKRWGLRSIFAIVLSGIAIFLSIVAICLVAPHTSNLSFDYQGVLVTALALLVTFLIGWQIYNIFDIEKRFVDLSNKFDGLFEEHTKSLDSKITKSSKIAISKTNFNIGLALSDTKQYGIAFYYYACSLLNIPDSNIENVLNNIYLIAKDHYKEIAPVLKGYIIKEEECESIKNIISKRAKQDNTKLPDDTKKIIGLIDLFEKR